MRKQVVLILLLVALFVSCVESRRRRNRRRLGLFRLNRRPGFVRQVYLKNVGNRVLVWSKYCLCRRSFRRLSRQGRAGKALSNLAGSGPVRIKIDKRGQAVVGRRVGKQWRWSNIRLSRRVARAIARQGRRRKYRRFRRSLRAPRTRSLLVGRITALRLNNRVSIFFRSGRVSRVASVKASGSSFRRFQGIFGNLHNGQILRAKGNGRVFRVRVGNYRHRIHTGRRRGGRRGRGRRSYRARRAARRQRKAARRLRRRAIGGLRTISINKNTIAKSSVFLRSTRWFSFVYRNYLIRRRGSNFVVYVSRRNCRGRRSWSYFRRVTVTLATSRYFVRSFTRVTVRRTGLWARRVRYSFTNPISILFLRIFATPSRRIREIIQKPVKTPIQNILKKRKLRLVVIRSGIRYRLLIEGRKLTRWYNFLANSRAASTLTQIWGAFSANGTWEIRRHRRHWTIRSTVGRRVRRRVRFARNHIQLLLRALNHYDPVAIPTKLRIQVIGRCSHYFRWERNQWKFLRVVCRPLPIQQQVCKGRNVRSIRVRVRGGRFIVRCIPIKGPGFVTQLPVAPSTVNAIVKPSGFGGSRSPIRPPVIKRPERPNRVCVYRRTIIERIPIVRRIETRQRYRVGTRRQTQRVRTGYRTRRTARFIGTRRWTEKRVIGHRYENQRYIAGYNYHWEQYPTGHYSSRWIRQFSHSVPQYHRYVIRWHHHRVCRGWWIFRRCRTHSQPIFGTRVSWYPIYRMVQQRVPQYASRLVRTTRYGTRQVIRTITTTVQRSQDLYRYGTQRIPVYTYVHKYHPVYGTRVLVRTAMTIREKRTYLIEVTKRYPNGRSTINRYTSESPQARKIVRRFGNRVNRCMSFSTAAVIGFVKPLPVPPVSTQKSKTIEFVGGSLVSYRRGDRILLTWRARGGRGVSVVRTQSRLGRLFTRKFGGASVIRFRVSKFQVIAGSRIIRRQGGVRRFFNLIRRLTVRIVRRHTRFSLVGRGYHIEQRVRGRWTLLRRVYGNDFRLLQSYFRGHNGGKIVLSSRNLRIIGRRQTVRNFVDVYPILRLISSVGFSKPKNVVSIRKVRGGFTITGSNDQGQAYLYFIAEERTNTLVQILLVYYQLNIYDHVDLYITTEKWATVWQYRHGERVSFKVVEQGQIIWLLRGILIEKYLVSIGVYFRFHRQGGCLAVTQVRRGNVVQVSRECGNVLLFTGFSSGSFVLRGRRIIITGIRNGRPATVREIWSVSLIRAFIKITNRGQKYVKPKLPAPQLPRPPVQKPKQRTLKSCFRVWRTGNNVHVATFNNCRRQVRNLSVSSSRTQKLLRLLRFRLTNRPVIVCASDHGFIRIASKSLANVCGCRRKRRGVRQPRRRF